MKPSHNEPDINRLYLLGKLKGDEREKFEQRYFADDEVFEQLEAAEDDLIDDYLTGDLSAEDSKLFRENLEVGKLRQQKFRVGQAWRNHVAAHPVDRPQKKIDLALGRPPAPAWQWRELFSPYPVKIAALAVVILIAAAGVWRIFFFESEVDKGLQALNAAYREQRPLESRITGLGYARFVVTRSGEPEKVNSLELDSAERILLDALKAHPNSSAAKHALGKYYLASKDLEKAIYYFEDALKADPGGAQIHADLAAALLEKGKLKIGRPSPEGIFSGEGMEILSRSLEHLNKALEIDSGLLEALFNRALVYEYMFLPKQAAEAWKSYLERDSNSQWAQEAKRRLSRLEERTKVHPSREAILESFLTAFRNNDEETAWQVITRNRDVTGGPVANMLIDQHLESANSGQPEDARQKLDALSYAGRLERERADDMYVADVVGLLKSLPAADRGSLMEARSLMEHGRQNLLKSGSDAGSYYLGAQKLLAQIGDTAELVYVEYPLGYSQLYQSKSRTSLATFDSVITQSQSRRYKWLQAQALNARANVQIALMNHSAALESSNKSLKLSEQIGDITGVIKTTDQLAQEYFYLGNYQESLAHHQRAFELSDDSFLEPRQGWRNYFSIPRTLSAMGFHAAAIEYEKEALRRAEELNMPTMVHRSYAIMGLIYGRQGNYPPAIENIDKSIELAGKFTNETARKESTAYSMLQLGLVHRQSGEFDKAFAAYDRAIQLYGELEDFEPFSYVAHKGKLLSCVNIEGCGSIEQEIKVCLDLFSEFREKILEQSSRDSFFDTEQDIYDVAIGYEFSRNNFQKAFDYSEEARGRSLWDIANDRGELTNSVSDPDIHFNSAQKSQNLDQIRAALPAQSQILQYAVLKDKVLIWLISDTSEPPVEKLIPQSALDEILVRYLERISSPSEPNAEDLSRDGKALYEILIQPVEAHLRKDKLLCIVPDKGLSYLPFSALVSTRSGTYLVHEYEIIYAPSASMFIHCSERAKTKKSETETLFAVGNPQFNQEKFSLPDLPSAVNEVQRIAGYYDATVVTGKHATKSIVKAQMTRSQVVHLAVHSIVDVKFPMRTKLIFAADRKSRDDTAGVLQAYEIYEMDFPLTHLVVLSACETGSGRYFRGEGMMGLSRSFLAAGVPLVVSTLWRVESESTADLMGAFHRHRRLENLPSSKALQRAQREMASGSDERYRSPYYWSGFTLAGGYAAEF